MTGEKKLQSLTFDEEMTITKIGKGEPLNNNGD
jgi:hypothetical protein